MRSAGGSRLVFALALGVLSLAIAVTPAGSAKKPLYKYPSKGETVGVAKRAGTTTWCPGGRRVMSGGISHDADSDVTIAVAIPVDRNGRKGDRDHKPDDGFRVKVDNATGSPLPIRVYAICARKPAAKSLIYRKASEPGESGVAVATVPCPEGSRVVGGGGAVTGAFGSGDVGSLEAFDLTDDDDFGDDGYRLYAHEETGTLTVHAVCAKGKFGRGLRYVEKHPNTDDGGFQQSNCDDLSPGDPGTFFVVGGAAVGWDLVINVRLLQFGPEDGGDSGFLRDNSWIAYAAIESAPDELGVTAICHK